jgi:hypothetical protein
MWFELLYTPNRGGGFVSHLLQPGFGVRLWGRETTQVLGHLHAFIGSC